MKKLLGLGLIMWGGAANAQDAVATQDLSAFNFDYRGPQIDAVRVDGAAATWRRSGGELTITPEA